MGGDEMLDELIGHPDEAIADAWRVRFDALLPGIVALDGAAPLLRALHGRGLVVMLATSSPEDLLATMREKIAADDAIDAVVSAGDVEQAKPAPDIFEVGLAKGGLDRDRSFVLGDSRWDVEAAARAGLRCVALECGGTSRSELLDAGALAVYRDPEALLDELDTSPFAVLLQD
jgi:HAD superfamily hydrolase (TIGR01509 family)